MNSNLDLDQRIRALGHDVRPPAVPVEEDVERGRRGLRRHRFLVTGGAVAGVAVIALGASVAGNAIGGQAAGPASTPSVGVSEPPTPDSPSPEASESPAAENQRTGAELLRGYRDVLAEHLDPDGTHLPKRPDNLQSGGGLGTKLGWTMPGQKGLGMVQVFVGRGWNGFIGAECGFGAECRTEVVDGVEARVIEWDGATTVVVRQDHGPVAITVDPLFGNNSLVPVEGMDIPLDAMVRAAADERLSPATREQVGNAGAGMGFPDVGDPGGAGASGAPRPE